MNDLPEAFLANWLKIADTERGKELYVRKDHVISVNGKKIGKCTIGLSNGQEFDVTADAADVHDHVGTTGSSQI